MVRFIVAAKRNQKTETRVQALLTMPRWCPAGWLLILKIIVQIFKIIFYSHQWSWYPSYLLTLGLWHCIFLGGFLTGLVEGLDEVGWKRENASLLFSDIRCLWLLHNVWVWGDDVITLCNDYLPIIEEHNIFSFSFSGIEVNLQFSAITSVGFLDMGLSGRTCTKRKWTDNVREKQGTMQQYIHSFM